MRKIITYGIAAIIIFAGIAYYLFTKGHDSLLKKTAQHSITAEELFDQYEMDEALANQKFLDQIIEVNGEIVNIGTEDGIVNIMLKTNSEISMVICQMEEGGYSESDFQMKEETSLKGICAGMLMDVVLVQCVKSNN